MPPALSAFLVPALIAALAYLVWRFVLRPAKGSQSTDDGKYFQPAFDHKTPVSNWVDPLLGTPSWRVPPAPPNPAGTDEERARRQLGLTADEPLPRVMVFTHPEKLPPGGLRCAVVLDDGYDYRPARDTGPALHSEGL